MKQVINIAKRIFLNKYFTSILFFLVLYSLNYAQTESIKIQGIAFDDKTNELNKWESEMKDIFGDNLGINQSVDLRKLFNTHAKQNNNGGRGIMKMK